MVSEPQPGLRSTRASSRSSTLRQPTIPTIPTTQTTPQRPSPGATPPDQNQYGTLLAGLDLVGLFATGCDASATHLAELTERLRSATHRLERVDPALQTTLGLLSSEAGSLAELGQSIRELERLQQRLGSLRFESIELGDLLMSIMPEWKQQAPNHSLELALPGELPKILASTGHAEQAINILIEAAVALAPIRSAVRVSIRPQLDDVLVGVQYAGPALSSHDLEHLFEPFYRPERLAQFKVAGGMGLTLARAILLAHGGRLWAQNSADGESSALLATWPLVPSPPVGEAPAAAQVSSEPLTGSRSRLTITAERPVILVMDTDSRMLRYLRANLEVQRYKPVLAKDRDEVFRLVDLEEPDLLLLDLHSSGLSPEDIDEFLLELQALVPAPILCLAEESDPVRCAQLLDLGAADYLAKPFGLEELLARIRVALRTHQAISRTPPRASRFQSGELSIDFSERRVMIGDRQIALSKTEFKLLRVLADHAGMVLPHEALLSRVWGLGYSQEVEFVWVYIRRLRKKIEPDPSMPTYIQTVPGVGYRLVRR